MNILFVKTLHVEIRILVPTQQVYQLFKKVFFNHIHLEHYIAFIICNLFEGLQAWINMKPYTHQLYNPIAVPYTVGVTRKNNVFDQKTSAFHLKPGHHIAINVFPKLVSSSNEFNGLDLGTRQCKLRYETTGFSFLNQYTRKGCELECAAKRASSFCRLM